MTTANRIVASLYRAGVNSYTSTMLRGFLAAALMIGMVGTLVAQTQDSGAVLEQAQRAVTARDFGRAAELYQQLEDLEPEGGSYAYNLGVVFLALDQVEDALAAFDRADDAGLQSTELDYNRGIAQYRLQQYEDALLSFDAALAAAPQDSDAAVNRALTLLQLEGPAVAEEQFLAIAESDPGVAAAWVHAGNIAFDRLDYDVAAQRFERALSAERTNRVAMFNRGNALLLAGMPDQALQQYEALQRIDPQFRDLTVNLELARQAADRLQQTAQDTTAEDATDS